MWFQLKVPGVTVDKLLGAQDAVVLGGRIAEATNKLHRAGVPTDKVHSIDDELKILRDCILQVAQVHPAWSRRLEEVIAACERVAATIPAPKPCGIHRDFYSSQVIVDGSRLWLLDFDLYCQGDPALDAGNFIGHITEQALRERGRADAFIEVERAMEDRFVELSGEATRLAVRAYTKLTLVRHIFLSTNFPDRRHLSESLLQLCEKRLN
jgi:aminoglycoside phosphotransferase (APT) family kinase protein